MILYGTKTEDEPRTRKQGSQRLLGCMYLKDPGNNMKNLLLAKFGMMQDTLSIKNIVIISND